MFGLKGEKGDWEEDFWEGECWIDVGDEGCFLGDWDCDCGCSWASDWSWDWACNWGWGWDSSFGGLSPLPLLLLKLVEVSISLSCSSGKWCFAFFFLFCWRWFCCCWWFGCYCCCCFCCRSFCSCCCFCCCFCCCYCCCCCCCCCCLVLERWGFPPFMDYLDSPSFVGMVPRLQICLVRLPRLPRLLLLLQLLLLWVWWSFEGRILQNGLSVRRPNRWASCPQRPLSYFDPYRQWYEGWPKIPPYLGTYSSCSHCVPSNLPILQAKLLPRHHRRRGKWWRHLHWALSGRCTRWP